MSEITMSQSAISAEKSLCQEGTCSQCGSPMPQQSEIAQESELSLAVLIAMVPLLVFTLFGQVGLL